MFANNLKADEEVIDKMNNQIEIEKEQAKSILEKELEEQDAIEHLPVFEEYIFKILKKM